VRRIVQVSGLVTLEDLVEELVERLGGAHDRSKICRLTGR
jgi:CBS domain containing-hemolysin-like protein